MLMRLPCPLPIHGQLQPIQNEIVPHTVVQVPLGDTELELYQCLQPTILRPEHANKIYASNQNTGLKV